MRSLLHISLLSVPLALLSAQAKSQESAVKGIVVDATDNTPLPYATVRWGRTGSGTVTDPEGKFILSLPQDVKPDTLFISFVGYTPFAWPVNELPASKLIEMERSANELKEVVVRPLTAKEYLLNVRRKLGQNYNSDEVELLAYYREQMTEDKRLLKRTEGAFKTYLKGLGDDREQQHQLLLLREADNVEDLRFMRDKLDKRMKKRKEKGKQDSDDIDQIIADNIAGPSMIFEFDVTGNSLNSLDTTEFKNYEYEYGEETMHEGRELVQITFRSKGKVSNLRQRGTILVDKASDAVVGYEEQGEVILPLALKPLMFVAGFSADGPYYRAVQRYQLKDGKWYPHHVNFTADIGIVKKKMFKKNERAKFQVQQVLVVNAIKTEGASAIPENHRFEPGEPMEEQVHNDRGLTWGEVQVLP